MTSNCSPDIAIFGDADGKSTTDDLGKEKTPYRFVLTRENLGVFRSTPTPEESWPWPAERDRPLDPYGTLMAGGDRTHVPLTIIGANPSVATKELNDNTIRKEIGFAQRLGFGRLVKGNAYGRRDTKPKNMWAAEKAGFDIVGSDNDRHLKEMLRHAWSTGGMVLVAWGKNCKSDRLAALKLLIDDAQRDHWYESDRHVSPDLRLVEPLWCLRTNQDGSPMHPLYVPYETKPIPWSWP